MSEGTSASSRLQRFLRILTLTLLWILLLPWLLWAFGALWFDFPVPHWSAPAAISFASLSLGLFFGFRGGWIALSSTALLAGLITAGWYQQKPMQQRNWKSEVAVLPLVEIDGDAVTVFNVRNFDYRTTEDFEVRYEERSYRLSQLQGVDLFLNYWGSELIAHPILSFDFGANGRICFSVETRPEKGEAYSALRGLYHGFELICIAADERDVIRLRTNYRENEDVYLYRLTGASGREAFLEYATLINKLHTTPEWYNAVTRNCTTSLRAHRDKKHRSLWDWRMLANGLLDKLLYERGKIDQSLPFDELKKRSRINEAAVAADQDPEFSSRIREAIPGFGSEPETTGTGEAFEDRMVDQ